MEESPQKHLLLALIKDQRPEGYWEINENLKSTLDQVIELAALGENYLSLSHIANQAFFDRVVLSFIIMEILLTKFRDQLGSLYLIIKKFKDWASEEKLSVSTIRSEVKKNLKFK